MSHESRSLATLQNNFEAIAEGANPYPHCLEIQPTDFCNQACDYCFHGGAGYQDKVDTPTVTTERYLKLFEEAEQAGIKELSISGGGEPFFARDIAYLLDALSDSDLVVRIVTQGNYIPEKALPGILAADDIRFSMDSVNPTTYNAMRGLPATSGMLSRTLSNIQKILNLRDQDPDSSLAVGCTFIISDKNYSEIEEFAEHMIDNVGIDNVMFKYDIYGDCVADPLQKDYIEQSLTTVSERYQSRVTVREQVDIEPNGKPCITPYTKIAVDSRGDVYSCCLGAQPGEENGYKFGSIQTDSLSEVWRNSTSIRSRMLGGVACRDCNHTDHELNNKFAVWLGDTITTRKD